jgi:hypothetical protein
MNQTLEQLQLTRRQLQENIDYIAEQMLETDDIDARHEMHRRREFLKERVARLERIIREDYQEI